MTISLKPRAVVVRVSRGLGPTLDAPVPALVERRGKRPIEMYLSPDTAAALGQDMSGYFEAEIVNGYVWIGRRLPDADRW